MTPKQASHRNESGQESGQESATLMPAGSTQCNESGQESATLMPAGSTQCNESGQESATLGPTRYSQRNESGQPSAMLRPTRSSQRNESGQSSEPTARTLGRWFGLSALVMVACTGGVALGTAPVDATSLDGGRDATPGIEDPSCNSHSVDADRGALPSGACMTGASCIFTLGAEACERPDATYYGSSQYSCACESGRWVCSITGGELAAIPCPGFIPPGITCADQGSCFSTACQSNEVCFTQVHCGPLPDGGSTCQRDTTADAGDDTCHKSCATDFDCPVGQDCLHEQFWGCTDFNGATDGKGICR